MNDIRIRADERPVGRIKSRPAAAHGEPRGDAGQRVTRLHDIPRGGALPRHECRSDAQRAGQGDLSSTTRNAGVRRGRSDGSLHADRHQDDHQDAPGEHHARGLRPHTHSAVTFLPRGSAPDAAGPDAEGTNRQEGKDLSGRHLRQVRPPDRHRRGTTRQPQQDQHEQRDQGSTDATLHAAPAAPADTAARAADAARAVPPGIDGSRGNTDPGGTGAPPLPCTPPPPIPLPEPLTPLAPPPGIDGSRGNTDPGGTGAPPPLAPADGAGSEETPAADTPPA